MASFPNYLVSLGKRLTVFWNKFTAAVRKSWRPASDQVEVLMLPENTNSVVQFYSLTEDHIYNSNYPETRGKEACFASLGWLLTVTRDEEEELKFNLLRPSNRANIELPDGGTALFRYKLSNICKFALSSNPCSTSDYIVMFQTYNSLAYCRPGLGQGWKALIFQGYSYVRDLTYYQGNFYVLDHSGRVSVVCDIEDPERAHLSVVAPEIPKDVINKKLLGPKERMKHLYLVESAGSLLVVLCTTDDRDYVETFGCRVFQVPFSSGNSWSNSEVKNLGNRALFLNIRSSSFSVEVSGNSGCKANCIYFINNLRASPEVDLDVGIFNMEDGTIDRDLRNALNTGDFLSRESRLWIQPSL